MDNDAEGSRARTQAALRRNAFNEVFDSVRMDIRNEADAGNSKTTYRLSERNAHLADDLVRVFTDLGYDISSDGHGTRPTLTIRWSDS